MPPQGLYGENGGMESQVHMHPETMPHLVTTEMGARVAKRQGFCPNHSTQEPEHQPYTLRWFFNARNPVPEQ